MGNGTLDSYASIDGILTISGASGDSGKSTTLTFYRDHTWTLGSNESDSRLRLPANDGTWKTEGFCDAQGDHTNVLIYSGRMSPFIILKEVNGFLGAWTCGGNFSGSGQCSVTKIDYSIGVDCV